MIRYHTATRLLLLAVAVVLGLTLAIDVFPPLPTHAQATNTPTITLATDQASVYKGGLAVFRLTRYGGQSGPITVRVKTWEPDYEDTSGQNETEQTHDIQFSSGSRLATLSVLSYIGARLDAGVLELKAQVLPSTDGSYQVGIQDTATVEVLDLQGTVPPTGLTAIGLWSGQASITEGWLAPLTFRVNRYGETSEPLSVGVKIEDPQGVLRGNHWDPPPLLPTQVEFAAGSASETLLIPVPDDQRHVQGASFKVVVLPSTDYLIRGTGEIGFELSEQVDVQQNETAQQLELHFGKDGVNDTDANEGDTLKFVVKRRQQDANTGKTATFVVRVETDRGGPDRLLGDWTEDTSTGRLFKNFPLELTGSDTEIGQEIEVIENGAEEDELELLGVDKDPGRLGGQHPHRSRRGRVLDGEAGFSGDDDRCGRQRGRHRHGYHDDRPDRGVRGRSGLLYPDPLRWPDGRKYDRHGENKRAQPSVPRLSPQRTAPLRNFQAVAKHSHPALRGIRGQ